MSSTNWSFIIVGKHKRKGGCFLNFPILATENKQETWTPQEGIPDRHIWRFSDSGEYSAKSAYEILFQGAVYFGPAQRIWKSHAPPKCRFFMWLAAHNRCWTADRLARRGLPHPARCLLRDQEEENIQHLLVGCVFTRQFWFSLLRRFGLSTLTPQPQDISFDDWWEKAEAGRR